jgi:hypothetical protein
MGVGGTADNFEPRSHLERQAEGAGEFGHTRGDAENHTIAGPCGHADENHSPRPAIVATTPTDETCFVA